MEKILFMLLWEVFAELEALKIDYAQLVEDVRGDSKDETNVRLPHLKRDGRSYAYLALEAWLEDNPTPDAVKLCEFLRLTYAKDTD